MKFAGYAIAGVATLVAWHLGVGVPFFIGGLVAIVFSEMTDDRNS